jgi:Flp pilus assembly protein TadD
LAAATTTAAKLNSQAPNDPETLARLGLLYAQQGQLTNAQPVLEKAVRLNPKDAASWQALGFVYQKLGNSAGVARVTAVLAKLSAKG